MDALVERCSRWRHQAGGKEEIHGCCERGYADSWCDRIRCRGQGMMEENDSL